MKNFYLLFVNLIVFFSLFISCNSEINNNNSKNSDSISGNLIIFHAGSLSVPLKEITDSFSKEYPSVQIIMEAAGSKQCARKISDLKQPCDIMASADYKVIENLLIPEYADWCVKFASNEMAIVYSDKSKYSAEINQNNWHEILVKKDVLFGRSDPNSDPCGVRAVLTIKLAEKYYKLNGFSDKMLKRNLNNIRPKETDLLALLESNSIDYIFLYRSVAEQHKLKYLILPDSINLKKAEFADFYKTVSIEVDGKTPKDKMVEIGEPMVYGVTIPKIAPNYKVAELFINYLLNENKGLAIMRRNGQPSVVPSKTASYDKLPENLKKFAIK